MLYRVPQLMVPSCFNHLINLTKNVKNKYFLLSSWNMRENLVRSIIELEVVISHTKETEVIIPEEKHVKWQVYSDSLKKWRWCWSFPHQSEVMSASACVRGMLTKLSVVPLWIRRRSPVPWLSQSLELLKYVFHIIHQNFDGILFSWLHFVSVNRFVQGNKNSKTFGSILLSNHFATTFRRCRLQVGWQSRRWWFVYLFDNISNI